MTDTVIHNSESSDSITLNDGDTLEVQGGGSATNTTINDGGIETVENGGTDIGATVNSGGEQDVFGSADAATVSAGGKQVVESGGSATNTNGEGGLIVVSAGGFAGDAGINNGSEQDVYGSASGSVIGVGSKQVIESGGSASNTNNTGGLEVISAGGFAGNAGASGGGSQDVFGSVSGSVIGFGGAQFIESGGSATSGSISSGGLEVVSAGGHDNGTQINAGGILEVDKGGIVTNAEVSSGGIYEVAGRGSIVTPPAVDPTVTFEDGSFLGIGSGTTLTGYTISPEVNLAAGDGGTVKSTTVASGTVLELLFSGTASNTHVASGGTEIVESGGFDVSGTVSAGGKLVVESGGQAFHTHVLSGGTYEVTGSATVDPNVIVDSGGIIEFGSGSTPVGFTAPSGVTLEIGDGLILNLGLGDTVSGLVVADGGDLRISGGSATATVVVDGGEMLVESGGSATSTLVHGGREVILAGGSEASGTVDGDGALEIAGTATNVTVKDAAVVLIDGTGSLSGGTFEHGPSARLFIEQGGSATGVTLSDGFASVSGTLNSATISVEVDVASGGTANQTDVESGGELVLSAGASASGTTVHSGGELVNDGGTDTATHVLSGGTLTVESGFVSSTQFTGSSISALIDGGGSAAVDSGGVIDSATLSGTSAVHGGSAVLTSAFLTIGEGGSATNTTIDIGKELVYFGGSDDSATINSGGKQDVDGGNATNATINSGGVQVVEEGGSATATTVNDHGEQDVFDDGAAFGTQINSGGVEVVFDGGTDSSATVFEGGKQIVNGGGSAASVTVSDGGEQDIGNGGEASGTTIFGDGSQVVSAGGSAVDTTINDSGHLTVEFGGVASGTIVHDGGELVLSGSHFGPATAIDTAVEENGTLTVLEFGVTSNATVFASGMEVVSAGGTAVGTTLSGGQEDVWGSASGTQITEGPFSARGNQNVQSGGVADHSHVDHGTLQVNAQGAAIEAFVGSDGLEIVQHGGFDSSTVVVGAQNVSGIAVNTLISGGTQTIDSGGFASGATFSGGGLEVVSNGGSALETFVFDGGEMRVESGGFASGAIVGGLGSADVESGGQIVDLHLHSGGYALVESGGNISGTTTISDGGTLEIQSGAITSGTAHVVFTGGGELIIGDDTPGVALGGVTVGGFPQLDVIDLSALAFVDGTTVSGLVSGGHSFIDVHVGGGGQHYLIAVDGSTNFSDYALGAVSDPDTINSATTEVTITPFLNVASASVSAPSEALHAGQKVTFTVQMNENSTVVGGGLKVTGTPSLLLNDGGKANYVAALSNLATGTLVFSYTVGAQDNVDDLTVTGASFGSGNSIQDTLHHNAVMGGAFIDTGITIDTIAPALGSATTTEPVFNNAIRAGDTVGIELTVIGGESLLVSGAPKITLSNGGTATYDAGKSHLEDGELVFDYTANAGQDTKAGSPLSVTSLSLNGGSIKDLAGNAFVITSVAGKGTGLTVDTVAPVVKVALKTDTGSSATDKITSNPTVTGTADPNATVNIFDGATFLNTATTDSKGNFTFTPTGLANGQHTITVTDTDLASNFGQGAVSFTLDTASPTIASYAHKGAAVTNAATVQYDIKFSESVTGVTASDFKVVVDSGNITTASIASVTAVAGSNGTEYIVTANTGKGDGTLEVDFHGVPVHDIAGNGVSTPTTVPFNHAVVTSLSTTSLGDFTAAATADFNGDGKADLVIAHGDVAVMLGKGDGTFQAPLTIASLNFVTDIAVGDFNGDGKADFIASDFNGNLLVRLGNGKGGFTAPASSPTAGSEPAEIATGDFNGDGKLDIAVANENGNSVSVLLGNGDGTFQAQNTLGVGSNPASLAVADLNHDGHADIVVANAGDHLVSVLLGNGDGSFQPQQTFVVGHNSEGIAVGDLNGDGKLDLVVTNDGDNTVSVLLGDGAGGFQAQKTFAAGNSPSTVTLVDVNADGVLDIVENASDDEAIGVLLGNGDGTFQNVVEFPLDDEARTVVTGDFNGDGRPDFASSNGTGVATFLNEPTAAGDIFTIDKTVPIITGATSPTAANTRLPLGGTMEIDVATIENVIVTNGAGLTLKLSDNGVAIYDAAHSTATKLAFDYTVGAGQNSTDLKTTALVLGKGTTVTDAAGNALNIGGAVNKDLGVIVDTNAPVVSKVAVTSTGASNTALLNGDTLAISLTFADTTAGDALQVTGTPTLTLSDGGTATYDHASGNTLVFNYTVGSESATDLKIVKFNFDQTHTITDKAGNPATIPASMADLKLTANVYTFTHKNGGDFDFGRAANWTPAQVPTHGNTALLTTAGTVTTSTDNTIGVLSVAKGVTLDIEGHHQFTVAGDGGDSTSVNAGTITVGDDSELELSNTALNNTGVINLKSTGHDTTLDILLSVVLSGKGTITLGDNAHNIIEDFASGTLTNVDNTISGAGVIGNETNFTLINQAKGIINANGTHALIINGHGDSHDSAGDPLDNAGLMEATGAGGLVIDLGTEAGSGAVNNTGGTFLASGTNAHVDFHDADVTGGTFKTTGATAAINVFGQSSINGVANTGTLNVTDGATLALRGAVFNNTGTVNINGTGDPTLLEINDSLSLQGGGKITLTGSGSAIVNDTFDPVTLTNVDNTISGVGTVGDGHITLVNGAKGVITATGASGLDLDAASVTNRGMIQASGANALMTVDTAVINNAGKGVGGATVDGVVQASGTNASLVLEHNTVVAGGTVQSIGAGAAIDIDGDVTFDASGENNAINHSTVMALAGNIAIGEGHSLTLEGLDSGAGSTFTNKAAITLNSANAHTAMLFIDGTVHLQGGGSIAMNADNTSLSRIARAMDPDSTTFALDNIDNTISGDGTIRLDSLTNGAKGIINGNASLSLGLEITNGITNFGILEGSSGDGLEIDSNSVSNSNLIEALGSGADVSFVGSTVINTTAGKILASGAGAHVDLQHVTLTGGTLSTMNGGAINVTSSSTMTGVTNTGTLNIADHQILTVLGTTLNNTATGVININDTLHTVLEIGTGGTFTLQGGGKINMNGIGNAEIVSGGNAVTFVNADNTIAGSGFIGDSNMTLSNQAKGVIDGNDATNSLVIVATHDAATNAGVMKGSNSGGLDIATSVINSNLIEALGVGARVHIEAFTITNTTKGSIVASGNGAHVDLGAGAGTTTIVGGTLNAGAGALIQTFDSPAVFLDGTGTGNPVNITGAGAVQVNGSASLILQGTTGGTGTGTFNNTGTIKVQSGGDEADLDISGDVTLKGTGKVVMTNAVLNHIGAAVPGSVLHNVSNTISGAGRIDDGNGPLTIDNQTAGTIIATETTALTIDVTTFKNAGKLLASGTGGLHLVDTTITNTGQIATTAANAKIVVDGVTVNGGTVSVIANSSFDVASNSTLSSAITNSGTFEVDASLGLGATGTLTNKSGAHIVLSNGSISGGASPIQVVAGSFLDSIGGHSAVNSALTNAGTADVSHGTLNLNGAVANTGTLLAQGDGLMVLTTVTGTGLVKIQDSGQIEVTAASSHTNVTFATTGAPTTGTLVLDHSTTYAGTITGFAPAKAGATGDFSNLLAFGDSSIDSGWFPTAIAHGDTANQTGSFVKDTLISNAVAKGGLGDPVGFGLMNSQVLANDFGYSSVPADATGGGNNYAIAGAVTIADAGGTTQNTPSGGNTVDPGNSSIGNLNKNGALPSTVQQIDNYLAGHGGNADPNALYLIGTGGNDTTFANDDMPGDTKAQKQAYLMHQAEALADEIGILHAAGAETIVVHSLSGDDPTANSGAGNFATLFDNTLFSALDAAHVDYVESDLAAMKNAIVANPTVFGFTAGTVAVGTKASTTTSSAFIDFDSINNMSNVPTPIQTGWGQWGAPIGYYDGSGSYAYLRAPNAEYTSLYSDDQHFSTQGQQIEADYDLAQIFAAGAAAMDSIDLRDIAYAFGTTMATYAGTKTGGTLTVTDGSHITKLTLTGDYTAANFVTATDGHGGTAVIEAAPSASAVADVTSSHLLDAHYAGAILAGMDYAVLDFTMTKAVTLAGDSGGVVLSSADVIQTNGTALTLTNNETIHGGGTIGDAFMTLSNGAAGIINADNITNGMMIQTSGHHVSNAGTIEATGGGWLRISNTTIDDTATAHFTVSGSNAGTGIPSLIDLDHATINGGIVTVGPGAILEAVNGTTSTFSGAVTNSGKLEAFSGSHLTINGAVTGNGLATVGSDGTLEFGAASDTDVKFVTFSTGNDGTLMLDHATSATSQFTGTILNFLHGNDIDLGAINYTGGNATNDSQAIFDAVHNQLTVSDGTHNIVLTFDADLTVGTDFHVVNDTHGHVDLLHV